MDIGDHGADVPRRIGRFFTVLLTRVLDAVQVVEDRFVEVHRVALVERVDLPSGGDLDVRVSEDEFAQAVVEREAVHAVARGEDEIGRGTVHRIASGDHLAPWLEDILYRAFGSTNLRNREQAFGGAAWKQGSKEGRGC